MSYLSNGSAELPKEGFVRLSTILKVIPICKTSWWNKVKSGEYPQPIKISARVTAWKIEDIRNLIQSFDN